MFWLEQLSDRQDRVWLTATGRSSGAAWAIIGQPLPANQAASPVWN